MARSRLGQSRSNSEAPTDRAAADGTGGFVRQIGLFETGNGMIIGPVEIGLAILAAVLIYPVVRLVRMARGR